MSSWSADLRHQTGKHGWSSSAVGGVGQFKHFKVNERILKWPLKCQGRGQERRDVWSQAFYCSGPQILNWLHFVSICHDDSCILNLFAFLNVLTLKAKGFLLLKKFANTVTCFTFKNRWTEHRSGTSQMRCFCWPGKLNWLPSKSEQ